MHRGHAFKDLLKKDTVILWGLLAFQAGFINAGGFIACHRFVSHLTGYGTQVGLTFVEKDIWVALEMAIAPLSFIAGSAFSAFLIDRPYFENRPPKIGTSLIVQSLLLVFVFVGGELGLFGEFGEPLELQRDFLLLFTLCFICGAQNAAFACLTNGQIRTTHMTGLATDLGMNLVRIPFLSIDEKEKSYQRKVNWMRLFIFFSFMIGSAISALVFSYVGYHGFLVPALTSFLVLYQSYKVMRIYLKELSTKSPMAATT